MDRNGQGHKEASDIEVKGEGAKETDDKGVNVSTLLFLQHHEWSRNKITK